MFSVSIIDGAVLRLGCPRVQVKVNCVHSVSVWASVAWSLQLPEPEPRPPEPEPKPGHRETVGELQREAWKKERATWSQVSGKPGDRESVGELQRETWEKERANWSHSGQGHRCQVRDSIWPSLVLNRVNKRQRKRREFQHSAHSSITFFSFWFKRKYFKGK